MTGVSSASALLPLLSISSLILAFLVLKPDIGVGVFLENGMGGVCVADFYCV